MARIARPIVATYQVRITLRGEDANLALTLEQIESVIEEAIENAVEELTARARAERTDK